ncbi:hypothetical protein G6F50_017410 [Rhizopus delemar]|uniref:Uncharacterized protein n=1 Tax=Rhizopus delemar TaxID=936053 RepID=A0A9P7C0M1_9FUNG|nr:hypothetical protein G6F50_017410 [Rhizopus delemar]
MALPESAAPLRSSKGLSVTNTMPALELLVKPLIDRPGNAMADCTPGSFRAMSLMRRITASVRSSAAPLGSCVKPIHARNAAIMNWAPCVKLTMLSRPKMMARPMLRMA